MFAKKMLAMLLVLCMVLGCMSMTAFAESEEAIALGENKTISVAATGGEYIDEYVFYSFTAEESGAYALYVSYDENVDAEQSVTPFTNEEIDYYYSMDGSMVFVAEADVTYVLGVNYWGVYNADMEYAVWVDVAPEDPEAFVLTVGENPMSIPEEGYLPVSFTPDANGYYLVSMGEEDMAYCWLSAESISDGTNDYYLLEAGVTYEGEAYVWEEGAADVTVTIEYFEDVEIPTPVAMEITKAPDNTTYLRENVDYFGAGDLLAGMEMEVTWEDGSVSTWSYDEDGTWLGVYYLEWQLVESEDKTEVLLSVPELEVEPVSFEVTILDLAVDHLELVDPSPLEIVENSCGIDIGELGLEDLTGWYYLPVAAYNREIVIVFTDGSTINAKPGDVVYGAQVYCEDNQSDHMWTKDSDNQISFVYGIHSVVLNVKIVDSPVESIEIVTPPTNNTLMMDEEINMVNADGEVVESLEQLFAGMSLKVNYKDGTSKTFAAEDFEWVEMNGEEYPFVDGYPIGILGGLIELLQQGEDMVPPCEIEWPIEYMGASDSYTLSFVEEFEVEEEKDPEEDKKDPIEDDKKDPVEDDKKPVVDDKDEVNPETGDNGLAILMIVTVVTMLCAVAMITGKKKLF